MKSHGKLSTSTFLHLLFALTANADSRLNCSSSAYNRPCWIPTPPENTVTEAPDFIEITEDLLLKSLKADVLRTMYDLPKRPKHQGPVQDEPMNNVTAQDLRNHPHRYIHFILYRGPDMYKDGVTVPINDMDALRRSGFRPDFPTKILIHGYNSDYLNGPGETMLPAYFRSAQTQGAVNVVLVNWANLAGFKQTKPEDVSTKGLLEVLYYKPAQNTVLVGQYLGSFINFLVTKGGTNPSLIHIIGFSLGAHVAGNAGMAVQPDFKIGRLTALDPAGPCFETVKYICPTFAYRMVHQDDAEFVDSIHTCGQLLGVKNPVGHVDFYPNGGLTQPGCAWWPLDFGRCSHVRAVDLMTETVERLGTGKEILADLCDSWDSYDEGKCSRNPKVVMGEGCDPDSRGRYMFKTSGTAPFVRLWP